MKIGMSGRRSSELVVGHEWNLQSSILIELEANISVDLPALLSSPSSSRFIPYPGKYIEKISLCNAIMKAFASGELHWATFINISSSKNINDKCRAISDMYFKPLYEYFAENIVETNSILYLLNRYRHNVEWFRRSQLYTAYTGNTRVGEDTLTRDLQEYLHNQGIDYPFSQPVSPSGRADLVGQLESDDPLVLEVKLFNPDTSYDKGYIRKGLTQAYIYAHDYGKPIGYLVIFNVSTKDIEFQGSQNGFIKQVSIGNKVILIICITIAPRPSASAQRKPFPYIIEDSYLIPVEEEENNPA